MTNSEVNEIKELAKFHSVEVECVYGDGDIDTDRVISLTELGRILWEVQNGNKE